MNNVIFRQMNSEEFDDVITLLGSCFLINTTRIKDDLNEVFDDIHVLYIEDTLIGVVVYGDCRGEEWEDEVFIRYLAIKKEYRQKGYAAYIINTIISELRKTDCPCIVVTIWQGDILAEKIWKSFGFEIYDEGAKSTYPNYDYFDSYVLWLE